MKIIFTLFAIVAMAFTLNAQTYNYRTTPAIGVYVDCPSDVGIWLGNTVRMKIISIDDNYMTFGLKKCDNQNFTTSGKFYVGETADCMDVYSSNFTCHYTNINSGDSYVTLRIPTSFYFNRNETIKSGAYKSSNGTVYSAGYISITRTLVTPSTPTGLTTTAQSTSSIYLSWNSTNDATSYDIYDCDGSYLTNTSNTYYTDRGLSQNTYYSYKVRAVNSAGYSSFTSCKGATTPTNPILSINPSGNQSATSSSGNGSI